jgi:hypothetical protein
MEVRSALITLLGGLLTTSGPALAEEGSEKSDLEVTIALITDPGAEQPDDVLDAIVIPGPKEPEDSKASDEGSTHRAEGQEAALANQAEALAKAEAARSEAESNRESFARGNHELPDQAPEIPGPPEIPTPP